MSSGRHAFGITHIGAQIFVVGGFPDEEEKALKTSENYDILKNKWTTLPCTFPDDYSVNMTIKTIKKRFIVTFGG